MPAIPQSVPTQPGSSTHQEREIESIPIRPCEHGPETGGLEAEPPGGRLGAVGRPCGSALHQRTGKLQFPVSGAGVPGSCFSWQEEATGSAGFMWSGEIACWLSDAQKAAWVARQAQGSHRGQRICCGDGDRPLCHSPTFLAGGGPLWWWEAAGISLHLAPETRRQISRPPRWL